MACIDHLPCHRVCLPLKFIVCRLHGHISSLTTHSAGMLLNDVYQFVNDQLPSAQGGWIICIFSKKDVRSDGKGSSAELAVECVRLGAVMDPYAIKIVA